MKVIYGDNGSFFSKTETDSEEGPQVHNITFFEGFIKIITLKLTVRMAASMVTRLQWQQPTD